MTDRVPSAAHERLHAVATGRVQGVGYRFWVREQARILGLCGMIRNLARGGVEVVAEGERETLERFINCLWQGPIRAQVTHIQISWSPAQGDFSGFSVRPDAP